MITISSYYCLCDNTRGRQYGSKSIQYEGTTMEMKKNVGASDRYIRFMIGLAFIMNIFSLEPTRFGMFVLLAIGALILNSAYTQYCFVYDLLDINTYEKKVTPPAEQPKASH